MKGFLVTPLLLTSTALVGSGCGIAPPESSISRERREQLALEVGEHDSRPIIGVRQVALYHDPVALDFAVKAKVYPEDRDTLFVTLRGGGVSLFDLQEPAAPRLRDRLMTDLDVEGQDRRGDLFVVVGRGGSLTLFDLSKRGEDRLLGTYPLTFHRSRMDRIRRGAIDLAGYGPFDALHVKLFAAETGRVYALVTAPITRELIAIDVTEPSEPVQIGSIDTGIDLLEAIYVHRGHAFVGGFGDSGTLSVIDVRDPTSMREVLALKHPVYRQLVAEMAPHRPDLLYVALWDDPGGLGIFDVRDPEAVLLVGHLLLPELTRSNRVKILDDHVFLPLEQDPGGFAVIDASDPTAPSLTTLVRGIDGVTMPYTLAVNGDHLYVFGTEEASLAVFEMDRAGPDPKVVPFP